GVVCGMAEADAWFGCEPDEIAERALSTLSKSGMRRQVLGRVARRRELGEQYELGGEFRYRAAGHRLHAFGVAGDVADEQVRLGHDDAKRRCHHSPSMKSNGQD